MGGVERHGSDVLSYELVTLTSGADPKRILDGRLEKPPVQVVLSNVLYMTNESGNEEMRRLLEKKREHYPEGTRFIRDPWEADMWVARMCGGEETLVWDNLNLWVSNLMLRSNYHDHFSYESAMYELNSRIHALTKILREQEGKPTYIITHDCDMSFDTRTEQGQWYQKMIARANELLGAWSEQRVFMAGRMNFQTQSVGEALWHLL